MTMGAEDFQAFFVKATGMDGPYGWQVELGAVPAIGNRLIRVPTGFGNTLGVLTAWTYNRVVRKDDAWPRRLVWCLPMRTLIKRKFFDFIRTRPDKAPPQTRPPALRLTFAEPVAGPLCLGYASHYGLGLFAAVPQS